MSHMENMKVNIQRTEEGDTKKNDWNYEGKNRMNREETIFEEKMAEKLPE